MNIEQERAEFEAALGRGKTYDERDYQMYLLGRQAALQSQDLEDAERYRWLRSAGKETERIVEDMYECALSGEDLDAAIDHARRIEGDGE